jgi:hypothetical protein
VLGVLAVFQFPNVGNLSMSSLVYRRKHMHARCASLKHVKRQQIVTSVVYKCNYLKHCASMFTSKNQKWPLVQSLVSSSFHRLMPEFCLIIGA